MIDREHDLPITRQAEALCVSRSSVYYLPRPVPEADLAIMRRLDRLHLEYPFAGARMLKGLLAAEGSKIGRRHVKTLMRRMGIEALYRRPRTTKPEPGYKIYPYLLREKEITRPNQVWAMDITYIPMARGFVYLAVVLDWASRRVLSWRVSITMEAAFLRRDPAGCLIEARQAGNLQYGPGFAVHRNGLHRRARRQRHCDQHGRQRGLAGQRVRRAAVAQRQVRGGVSDESVRQRRRCARIDRPISQLLQSQTTPFELLTKRRLIKPTSPRCPSAWQPNLGRGSTYRRGKSVQTTGTTSAFPLPVLPGRVSLAKV